MEKFLKKYYRIFFGGVAILLLYPTFARGYIFLLDWLVEPNISRVDINPTVDSVGLILYKLGGILFSFGVFQRIFLFATVYFLGIAGFRLAKRTGNVFAQYFAGLFLIFNPFVYARLMEQPGVALGSVLFFWFLVYFLEYLQCHSGPDLESTSEQEDDDDSDSCFHGNEKKKLLAASFCAAFSVSIFTHSIFFIGATVFLLFLSGWIHGQSPSGRQGRDWKFFVKTFAIIFGIIIMLNVNWLFSFVRGSNQGVGGIGSFSLADAKAFSTADVGDVGVYFTVLSLQGYWGEYQDRFVSIQENPLWWVAFLGIFFLAVLGWISRFKKKDCFAKPLLALAVVSFVLAIGISSAIFAPLANFLYAHFPLYIGLRESQKWVVILVFFYAYFGAWGIADFLKFEKIKNFKKEAVVFLVLLPIFFSFPIVRGAHEHLTPHEFPTEWRQAKRYLDESETEGKILFLPWHLYMKLDFAGKNVVVPAQSFFGKNIVMGNNTEFGGVYSHSEDAQTFAVEKYVQTDINKKKNIDCENFSVDMRKIGIELVMLAKTEDWQKYQWLDRIDGAKKVLENDKIIIYKLQ